MENPLENWGVTWQRNPKTWTNPWIFVTFRCFVRPEWVLTPIQKGPNPGFDPSFLIPVLIGGFTENLYFLFFFFGLFDRVVCTVCSFVDMEFVLRLLHGLVHGFDGFTYPLDGLMTTIFSAIWRPGGSDSQPSIYPSSPQSIGSQLDPIRSYEIRVFPSACYY